MEKNFGDWANDCELIWKDIEKITKINFVNYMYLYQICDKKHKKNNFCDCCNECIKCRNKKLIKYNVVENKIKTEIVELVVNNKNKFSEKEFKKIWEIGKTYCLLWYVGFDKVCEKCLKKFSKLLDEKYSKNKKMKIRIIKNCLDWFSDDNDREIVKNLGIVKKLNKEKYSLVDKNEFLRKYHFLESVIVNKNTIKK